MPDGQAIPFNQESLEIIGRRAAVESSVIVAAANALLVVDAPSYEAASELRKELNRKDAILDEEFKKQTRALDAAKRTVLDFAAKVRGPYQQGRKILDDKMLLWQRAEEAKRREAEARLREEAAKREEERRLREAEQAVKEGASQEEALAIIDEPPAPLPVLPSSVPKLAGQSTRVTWKARVTNRFLLICHIAMHPDLVNLVLENETALNALARAQKAALELPGVEAYSVESISGSRT